MAAASFFSNPSPNFTIIVGGTSGNSLSEPRVTHEYITSFEDDSYALTAPMLIEYERVEYGYMASFPNANIAVSGDTKFDARQALEYEILDAFDDWVQDESKLGPGPKNQLAVLKQHIKKR